MYIDQDKRAIVEEIRSNIAGILADLRHMKAACDRIINYQPPRVSKAPISYRSLLDSIAPVVIDEQLEVSTVPAIIQSEDEQSPISYTDLDPQLQIASVDAGQLDDEGVDDLTSVIIANSQANISVPAIAPVQSSIGSWVIHNTGTSSSEALFLPRKIGTLFLVNASFKIVTNEATLIVAYDPPTAREFLCSPTNVVEMIHVQQVILPMVEGHLVMVKNNTKAAVTYSSLVNLDGRPPPALNSHWKYNLCLLVQYVLEQPRKGHQAALAPNVMPQMVLSICLNLVDSCSYSAAAHELNQSSNLWKICLRTYISITKEFITSFSTSRKLSVVVIQFLLRSTLDLKDSSKGTITLVGSYTVPGGRVRVFVLPLAIVSCCDCTLHVQESDIVSNHVNNPKQCELAIAQSFLNHEFLRNVKTPPYVIRQGTIQVASLHIQLPKMISNNDEFHRDVGFLRLCLHVLCSYGKRGSSTIFLGIKHHSVLGILEFLTPFLYSKAGLSEASIDALRTMDKLYDFYDALGTQHASVHFPSMKKGFHTSDILLRLSGRVNGQHQNQDSYKCSSVYNSVEFLSCEGCSCSNAHSECFKLLQASSKPIKLKGRVHLTKFYLLDMFCCTMGYELIQLHSEKSVQGVMQIHNNNDQAVGKIFCMDLFPKFPEVTIIYVSQRLCSTLFEHLMVAPKSNSRVGPTGKNLLTYMLEIKDVSTRRLMLNITLEVSTVSTITQTLDAYKFPDGQPVFIHKVSLHRYKLVRETASVQTTLHVIHPIVEGNMNLYDSWSVANALVTCLLPKLSSNVGMVLGQVIPNFGYWRVVFPETYENLYTPFSWIMHGIAATIYNWSFDPGIPRHVRSCVLHSHLISSQLCSQLWNRGLAPHHLVSNKLQLKLFIDIITVDRVYIIEYLWSEVSSRASNYLWTVFSNYLSPSCSPCRGLHHGHHVCLIPTSIEWNMST